MRCKKNGTYGIYSFVRKENLLHYICKQYRLSNNDDSYAQQQMSSIILTHNLSNLSRYLENATQFEKEYIVKHESRFVELMKETDWLKGIKSVVRILQVSILHCNYIQIDLFF